MALQVRPFPPAQLCDLTMFHRFEKRLALREASPYKGFDTSKVARCGACQQHLAIFMNAMQSAEYLVCCCQHWSAFTEGARAGVDIGLPRSAGCNILRQWDLTRAVPHHVRDINLVKGDVLGIATRRGFVYTCGADGSIRC